MTETQYRAPADCPVCAHELSTSRLSCSGCGTELVGRFERCRFCTLPPAQLELLTVFLASRGNLREVARHQGVSYPTARARLAGLLAALGLDEIGQPEEDPVAEEQGPGEPVVATQPLTGGSEHDETGEQAAPQPTGRAAVLARVASGELSPEQAAELIRSL
ncbi:DUF2089 family protein [Luteococcus peritonei]|uniref:DUF2089 family protein n=1 Tax=Luteococcus peritonei TaxID=88874 RepID=A0ABW4RZM9_9ACTN